MAAGNWIFYEENAATLLNGGGPDFDTDAFAMVLVNSTYTPSQADHTQWSSVSANEVALTGYTAGGKALASLSVSAAASRASSWDAADVAWTSIQITAASNTKYAVIVKGTAGSLNSTDLLVCYCELESGGTVTLDPAGDFTVGVANICTLTVAAS